MDKSVSDNVNHPPHYTSRDIYTTCECGVSTHIECIDITRNFNFNLGNALKYIWRADYKARTIEDLKKAVWYINDEIKQREKQVEFDNSRQYDPLGKLPYKCAVCYLTFMHKEELDTHWLLCHDDTQVNT